MKERVSMYIILPVVSSVFLFHTPHCTLTWPAHSPYLYTEHHASVDDIYIECVFSSHTGQG